MKYAKSHPLLLVLPLLALLAVASFYFYMRSSNTDHSVADLRGRSQVSVVLTEKGFEPRDIRISKGTEVVFTTTRANDFWPAANPHPVHSTYPAFDPRKPIEANSSWSFRFEEPGTWAYHDHIRSYFTGLIYVEA